MRSAHLSRSNDVSAAFASVLSCAMRALRGSPTVGVTVTYCIRGEDRGDPDAPHVISSSRLDVRRLRAVADERRRLLADDDALAHAEQLGSDLLERDADVARDVGRAGRDREVLEQRLRKRRERAWHMLRIDLRHTTTSRCRDHRDRQTGVIDFCWSSQALEESAKGAGGKGGGGAGGSGERGSGTLIRKMVIGVAFHTKVRSGA